jgi:hypothetical protein
MSAIAQSQYHLKVALVGGDDRIANVSLFRLTALLG